MIKVAVCTRCTSPSRFPPCTSPLSCCSGSCCAARLWIVCESKTIKAVWVVHIEYFSIYFLLGKVTFQKERQTCTASKPIANRPLHVATHLNYSTSLFTTHSHSGFVAQLLDLVPHLYLPYQRHYLPIAIHPTQLVPTHHQFPNKLVVQELKLPLDLRPPAVMP